MARTDLVATKANGNGAVENGAENLKNNLKQQQQQKGKLSSTQLIALEDQHAAHNYHPLPVVFDRALGAKVWDPEGNEYIDMLSAYSAVNQGHCHPRIIGALIAQAQKLTLSSRAFHNSVMGVWAEKMTTLFGYDMVLPINTGAEAVESAIKLARKWAYTVKRVPEGTAIVLSVEGNFHGRTVGVVSMSTDPTARTGFGPFLPGVGPTFVDPETGSEKVIRFGEISDVERAFELYSSRIAAFLVEPIQGEAGINVPSPGYLPAVAALCKKHNILLICDEVQTGLGRTGRLLASDHSNIRPDMILLGKALSGGAYPVSAVLADKSVMLSIKPGEHGSTYGGNPLGCAVSIAALQVLIDEDLSARADRLGNLFRTKVKELNSPYITTVRGLGLLNAIVVDEDACNASRARRGLDITRKRTAWQFCLLLKEKGVLAKTTHGNVVRFAPPLVIEEADLLRAVQIIGECLVDLEARDEVPEEGEEDDVLEN
ncbi:ornithine aminotransferase [Favolaschia claudopus]|uniref:ornithine aminotransferase n=1 Tax=Favolaschia claudopus TaxID=2862362 RepID=A0AAW0EJ28_9AGAR